MNIAFHILIDDHLCCFASAKKRRMAVGYYLDKNRINLYVCQHRKGFLKVKQADSENSQEDLRGETTAAIEKYLITEKTEYLLNKNLELGNKIEIQLLESDKPSIKGEVSRNPKRYVNFAGEKVVVKNSDHILFEQLLTKETALHVFIKHTEGDKYELCIGYQDNTKEYSKKTYSLHVGDNIQITYDRDYLEKVKTSMPLKAAG